jgi:hypothetical protein
VLRRPGDLAALAEQLAQRHARVGGCRTRRLDTAYRTLASAAALPDQAARERRIRDVLTRYFEQVSSAQLLPRQHQHTVLRSSHVDSPATILLHVLDRVCCSSTLLHISLVAAPGAHWHPLIASTYALVDIYSEQEEDGSSKSDATATCGSTAAAGPFSGAETPAAVGAVGEGDGALPLVACSQFLAKDVRMLLREAASRVCPSLLDMLCSMLHHDSAPDGLHFTEGCAVNGQDNVWTLMGSSHQSPACFMGDTDQNVLL